MLTDPSTIYVVILRTLPMLEIEPSTFCAICVSISVGAAPGCEMIDVHERIGDIGVQIDRQANKGDDAEKEQHHEQHDRRDGVANGPGGNILHELPAVFRTGLTTSPSCRNAPAVATT